MAYRAGASVEASEDATDPIEDRLGLVDLTTGADSIYFDVRGLAFRDDGPWLAALGVPASDSVGADLVVMNPGSGARTVIGNVSEFAWQDHGRLLAATVKTAWGGTNGVLLFDPSASTLRTIDSRDAEYASLTWQEESTRLAVLRSVESEDREESSHDVLVWDDPTAGPPRILAAMGRADLGEDIRVTPYAGVRFSDDGRTLFVGVRTWEHAEVEATDQTGSTDREGDGLAGAEGDLGGVDAGTLNPDDGIDPADVQVWHWNDDQILRAQEYGAARIARQVMTAAWHTDSDRFVVLSDDLEEPVSIVAGGRWGVVPDYTPYLFGRRFGARTADWYRVDPRDGTRAPIAEQLEFGLQSHADLDRVLVYRDDHWTAVRLSDLSEVVLGDGRDFTQSLADFDFPGPRPPWGVGAWVSGGGKALLYDANDVWVADLSNGRLTQATQGPETNEQFRVVNLDPDQSPFGPALIESESDVMLSVRNLRTKASGYARLAGRGRVDRLLMRDARVTGLAQARSVDRYALRIERWDDSPDVFVGSQSLADLTQVTRTNPFQADYAWGRAELLDYTIGAGLDLQAILVYPANFQPGQQYPLILYQYERLSDNLHVYDAPSRRDYYNYQVWSQQGYFVLMPDIAYEPGRPGPSALDAVEHALDAAVATGHVDPARMGIIGHSWGGYQAAYLPTRTDRFAASVAGAAITNFMSFMGAVHWNGGLPETGHWETGQARMAVPYWEDPAGHLESSPANFITQLRTPMLLMHGDADGVVDFRQGLEFYNYARRAGKEVVLLVYPGADHGLSDESQQVDYHDRILEWFGHFLKGEPAPSWITDGENWTQRAKRIGG
jgi:dienelactone hydrolase